MMSRPSTGHVVRLVGSHELEELNWVVQRRADMESPTPQMSSRPVARRTAGCTSSHQNDQNASHSLGNVLKGEARLLEEALPDVDVVGRAAHRQPVEALLPGPLR